MAISIVAALATMVSVANEPAQARFNTCDDGDVCVRGGEGQKGGGGGGQFSVTVDPFTDSERGCSVLDIKAAGISYTMRIPGLQNVLENSTSLDVNK